jgi:hypothetical protein
VDIREIKREAYEIGLLSERLAGRLRILLAQVATWQMRSGPTASSEGARTGCTCRCPVHGLNPIVEEPLTGEATRLSILLEASLPSNVPSPTGPCPTCGGSGYVNPGTGHTQEPTP